MVVILYVGQSINKVTTFINFVSLDIFHSNFASMLSYLFWIEITQFQDNVIISCFVTSFVLDHVRLHRPRSQKKMVYFERYKSLCNEDYTKKTIEIYTSYLKKTIEI